MATITGLSALAKTSVGANDYLLTANGVSSTNNKFLLQDLFPTVNTIGTSSESLFINITSKNALNFKGIKSLNSLLTVATASNNITLQVNEANIDLSNCDNSTSAFLSSVSLASNVTGTLPVANGGTGATSLTANSLLLGNGTSAFSALGAATNGQLVIGRTGLSPVLATLTAGSNVSITNGAGAITIAASFGTFTSAVNAAGYNLYATGWISGDTSNRGIKVTTTGQTFVGSGSPTAFFTSDLNVNNSITLNGAISQTISPILQALGTAANFTVKGTDSYSSSVGGHMYVKGGGSAGAYAGGDLFLAAGKHDGTGSAGKVFLMGVNTSGVEYKAVTMESNSAYPKVGIFTSSPLTTLDVEQGDSGANRPVVRMSQSDTNESFINFVGTSGAASANSLSSSTATAGAKTGAIKVQINGVDAWIRVYATAE